MPSWPAVATLTTATAATTTAISATAAAIPAAAATTTGAFFARAGNIHREVSPVEAGAIQGIHGFLGFFLCAHGDESESARPAAVAIGHEIGFEDRAVRGESVLQIVFGGVEGEVSDKQFIIHAVVIYSFLESLVASESVPVSGLESPLNLAHATIYHRLKVMSNPTIRHHRPFR
jgi:hypothetical protein